MIDEDDLRTDTIMKRNLSNAQALVRIKKIIGFMIVLSVAALPFTVLALKIGLLSATVVVSVGIILAGVLMKGVDMMYP